MRVGHPEQIRQARRHPAERVHPAVAEFVHTVFPFTTTDEWRTAEYKKARDFVNAALKYNPDERPTVADLLKMPFVA